jgi:DNA polymerase III delta prime subunit
LNASDERGIDVVREQIKMFAKKKLNLPVGIHKIIILDEADKYLTFFILFFFSSFLASQFTL